MMKLYFLFWLTIPVLGNIDYHCDEVITAMSESIKIDTDDRRGVGVLYQKQTFHIELEKAVYLNNITVHYFSRNSSKMAELEFHGYLENTLYLNENQTLKRRFLNQPHTFYFHRDLVDRFDLVVRSPYHSGKTNSYMTYEIRGCPIDLECYEVIMPSLVAKKSYQSEWTTCPFLVEVSLPYIFEIRNIKVKFDLESAPLNFRELYLYGDFITSSEMLQGETSAIADFSRPANLYPRGAKTDKFWIQPWPLPDCSRNDFTPYMILETRGCPYIDNFGCDEVLPTTTTLKQHPASDTFGECSQYFEATIPSEFNVRNFTVYIPPREGSSVVYIKIYYKEGADYQSRKLRIPMLIRNFGTLLFPRLYTHQFLVCFEEEILPDITVELRGCMDFARK